MYDLDARLQGEVQPQLEVTPITKYGSDPQLVVGRQIAVNKVYICYGLKGGNIRILNINTALRSLFRGHTQRVTDMVFFAEDVHLLASVSVEGRIFVWKISEGSKEEDKPQITGKVVTAVQISGETESARPRVCWHCHKQEILVVGIGKHVLRIDTTKVGKGEMYSADSPLQCHVDKLIDGIQLVGKHDGEVTDLSMCQWMTSRLVSASVDGTIKIWEDRKAQPLVVLRPHDGHPVNSAIFLTAPHQPDHIVLITGGPLNREVKIWASASEEGWLLPCDAKSWKCTQILEFKSSAVLRVEEAFFNQVAALAQAGILLLANAKRNAIYAVHLEYGPFPAATHMDYISEFTVKMPILSFTGTNYPPDEHVKVYCVQTQAIQQYTLELCQCLPPPSEDVGAEKLDSSISHDMTNAGGVSALDPSGSKKTELLLASSAPKPSLQISSSEGANAMSSPVSSTSMEAVTSQDFSSLNGEPRPALPMGSCDAESVAAPPHPLSLSPRLSRNHSGFLTPTKSFDPAPLPSDNNRNQSAGDYSVDRQMDTIKRNLSDVHTLGDVSRNNEIKVASGDESGIHNLTMAFKHPTHLITPSEILMAVSSTETSTIIEGKNDGNANIQDVIESSGVGNNAEVEVKVVGEARSVQNNEFPFHGGCKNLVSENREKVFCSQASDLGLGVARECFEVSEESYIPHEGHQVDAIGETEPHFQPSLTGDEGGHDSRKDASAKVPDSTAITTLQQSPAPSTKGKKHKGKNSQGSGLSSPSSSIFNSADSYNEPGRSLGLPCSESFAPQIFAMQEMLNQLMTTQKEMQKQISSVVNLPVAKEGRRLEAALGRSIEKAVKANADALWARFQEENGKNEKLLRDRTQQITNLISNFMNKDLTPMFEKAVKKEFTAIGPAILRTITPAIEKTVSSAVAESFQRGLGDKAVNQLDKSVNSKLEASVARQIQAQFQISGKQALQDALKSGLEVSIVPAFDVSCKAMFEQVDATFQKGMVEHTNAVWQHFETTHSPLTLALRDAINSASSMAQTLSGELADGQRKLLAVATAGTNTTSMNSMATQLGNGPFVGLNEKVETPLDPTKELSRLISEHKYDKAFTIALQRSDVSIVSWLCSQVDLHGILAAVPLPLSQGVFLSLLQQLACDISKDTSRKLAWMTDVAAAINPADQMIAVHVRPIFEQVNQILHHQQSSPTITGGDILSIRLLMHVINSMLMSCK